MPLQLRARGLDQAVIFHSGGTRRDACHTAQALVEVPHVGIVHAVDLTFQAHLHQVNAAARRIHLLVPEQVGGTGGQAETAVNALVDQLVRRWMMRIEDLAGPDEGFGERGHSLRIPRRRGDRFRGSRVEITHGRRVGAGAGRRLAGADGSLFHRPMIVLGHQIPPTKRPRLRVPLGSN